VELTSADALRRELTDFTRCPSCGTPLASARCGSCGLDLAGPAGERIADASRAAARALDERRRVIWDVRAAQVAGAGTAPSGPTEWAPEPVGAPGTGPVATGPVSAPVRVTTVSPPGGPAWSTAPIPPRSGSGAVPPPGAPAPFAPAGAPQPGSGFDVVRLFVLAGAGLVAAAALVFAFFVLAEAPAARVAVLVLATAGAAAGTLVLRRKGIGSSAEAVGGLVAALAVVDAWVVAALVGGAVRWVVLAFLLLAVGLGLPAAGLAARVRAWTAAVLVLPLVPLCVAGAVGSAWGWHLALLAAAVVTLVRVPHRRLVRDRFGAEPSVVGVLLTLAAAGLLAMALFVATVLPPVAPRWETGAFAVALLLAAAVARAQAPAGLATAWTWAAGALAVLSGVAVLPLGVGIGPLTGAAVWALLVLVPTLGGRPLDADPRYRALVSGGWVALVASTVPAAITALASAVALLGGVDGTFPARLPGGAFAATGVGSGGAQLLAVVVLAAPLAAIGRLRLAPVWRVPLEPPAAPGPVLPPVLGPALPPVLGAASPPVSSTARPATSAGTSAVPTPHEPGVRAVGRVCLPAATVLAVVVAAGLLRPWAAALLVGQLLLAAALVEGARRVPASATTWRTTLTVAVFGQIALLTVLTWVSRPTVALGAVAVVLLLLRSRPLVLADLRGALVGLATAYAGAVLAVWLAWAGWDGFGVVGGVAVALTVVAVVLTVVPRVGQDTWLAVLVVAAVPAALGIAAVAVERTWWSAGVAAALIVLEVVLLDTRSRPVAGWLRVLAAGLVVPTVAVLVICAGAVLLPGSGSPVLLPVVAVLAAAAAIAAPAVADRLRRRVPDIPDVPAGRAREALELASAGTGAVALLLGIVRASTGAETVLALCAILGAGATALALRPDRRPVWWVAAVLWSGVVWSALAWWGVGLVEAYTAPPAVAAVVVGTLLARRGDRWRPLVAAGTALLVAPTLVLALLGAATGARSAVLLAFAAVGVGATLLVDRAPDRRGALRALTDPLLLGTAAAALAGPIRAGHLAADTPAGSGADNARLFGAAVAWSLTGALLLAVAGRLVSARQLALAASVEPHRRAAAQGDAAALRRWALAPALVAGTIGALAGARDSWAVVWVGWAVELALLAAAVLAVRAEAARAETMRGQTVGDGSTSSGSTSSGSTVGGSTAAASTTGGSAPLQDGRAATALAAALPPGWFLWLVALAWAIGGWSPRELRVEVFALPLGLALTAMGFVALRAALAEPDRPVVGPPAGGAWPVGWRTSVATLTPGILATLGPSMLAIWTDPMTWRAILVVVLALGFMLLGARQMLRAPLVVGAGALPVAVVSVFAAQIGRTISAGPWLLTLLAAGGLLLVLGIFAERRRSAAEDRTEVGAPRALR
jgi:hypothetical protein